MLDLVRSRYSDFGPTLAAEKLAELDGITVSRETLRHWMRDAGIWVPRRARVPLPHQPRYRRECLGELVQIDGCQHAWFEERAPACTVLVYVDDATGRLMELRFVEVESAFDYFDATASYLRRHGKPTAYYSDKHSIFRSHHDVGTGRAKGTTQFGRALDELNIEIICANSPQAKGRVERMNLTLQDRLVKELRLRGISSPEAANAYAPEFIEDYNRRFARPARNPHDAHRPLQPHEDLAAIFSWQEDRTVSRNLVVHYKRVKYLVTPGPDTADLGDQVVRVHEWQDGRVEIRHGSRALPFTVFDKNPTVRQGEVVENKRLGAVLTVIQGAQAARDEARLASPKLTVREKSRIKPATAAAPATPLAAAFTEYLARFTDEQKARTKRYNDQAHQRRRDAQQAALQAAASGPPTAGS